MAKAVRSRWCAEPFVTPPSNSHNSWVVAGGAIVTALAAWVSQGTIAATVGGAERVALLPISVSALGLAVAAGALTFLVLRRGVSAAPVELLWPLQFRSPDQ